jgi:hypothetical protein
MPRKPNKIKTGEGDVRVTLMLPADDLRAIDAEAKRRSKEDVYGRDVTRSHVVRLAVHKFLENKEI